MRGIQPKCYDVFRCLMRDFYGSSVSMAIEESRNGAGECFLHRLTDGFVADV